MLEDYELLKTKIASYKQFHYKQYTPSSETYNSWKSFLNEYNGNGNPIQEYLKFTSQPDNISESDTSLDPEQYAHHHGLETSGTESPAAPQVDSSLHQRWKSYSSNNSDLSLMSSVSNPTGGSASVLESHYNFAGIHHIFDQSEGSPIFCLKFANVDRSLLAFSNGSGKIYVANTIESKIKFVLCGHKGSVVDLDWSMSNVFIVSASLDHHIKFWDVATGACLRTIAEKFAINCISFHPIDENIVIAGVKNQVKMFNVSTGRVIRSMTIKQIATSLSFSTQGRFLFVGDYESNFYIFSVDGNKLKKLKTIQLNPELRKPITSISYSQHQTYARNKSPMIILNDCSNSVRLFRFEKNQLVYVTSFPIPHQKDRIRSIFCPLITNTNGACFVSGSENGEVFLFDLTKPTQSSNYFVNSLKGHGTGNESNSVLSVALNYEESILASGDKQGIVILWKRTKNVIDHRNDIVD